MNKSEKGKVREMLEAAVKRYEDIQKRDDFPEKPCVDRWAKAAQNAAFSLADYLYHYGFISWEECCSYWSRAGILDDESDVCSFRNCEANIDGSCKYYKEKKGGCQ